MRRHRVVQQHGSSNVLVVTVRTVGCSSSCIAVCLSVCLLSVGTCLQQSPRNNNAAAPCPLLSLLRQFVHSCCHSTRWQHAHAEPIRSCRSESFSSNRKGGPWCHSCCCCCCSIKRNRVVLAMYIPLAILVSVGPHVPETDGGAVAESSKGLVHCCCC